ncbi:regulatory protein RecX [Paenibacillus rigui]|uniref:Regulatory protein RecX n=1 Tax=Paenibacillus rigui TaxID=554312 RepID=A0A229UN49_9BACL|nr:RecX family transcriptional regulator [Paenibacillus rigui]OXM84744.1 recombinase RecX [Paenibacillus rigui]
MNHDEEDKLRSGTITKVERQKRVKDRYNLYIDDEFAFSVHEDILIRYKLVKGSEVEEEGLRAIVHAQEKQRAYLYAVRLLGSRLRSEHELWNRLKQKGYDPVLATTTVERLKQEQYVNDAVFAEQLTKQRVRSQKKGRNWVKQELQFKGIDPIQISKAIQQIDEETEYRSAYELVYKKYRKEFIIDAKQAQRKAMGFLLRRGYSSSLVSKVVREVLKAFGEELEDEMNEFGFE